jgi:hypothetical protein
MLTPLEARKVQGHGSLVRPLLPEWLTLGLLAVVAVMVGYC